MRPHLAGPGRRLRGGQHPRRRRVRARLAPGGDHGRGKQKSYDDFAAVAEDLIATGGHAPQHLGIQGGSNGGLLVGAVMLQRPELFGAVVCQVPLLDMRRYHKLLAGCVVDGRVRRPRQARGLGLDISRYSPYQNVKAGHEAAAVLFTTSTRDDRVHPGHARKMAARMLEQGHPAVLGEHRRRPRRRGRQRAARAMRRWSSAFLWRNWGGAEAAPARPMLTGSTTTARCRRPAALGPDSDAPGLVAAGGRVTRAGWTGLPQGHLSLVQPGPAGAVVEPRPAHGAAGGRVPRSHHSLRKTLRRFAARPAARCASTAPSKP
jgi:hypothetical protein